MSLKIALVGCGKIADGHVEEIKKIENTQIVGVCDLEKLMAEQLAVRYGVENFYDDFSHMLEVAKPDVVHITTPPRTHLPLASQAIDAGAHVYVEKPLTTNYEEAKRLVDTAEQAGKKLTVGYTYMYDPPARAMRALIDKGVLGDAVHVESFYGYNLEGQFGAPVLKNPAHWLHGHPGNLFHNNIDHALVKVMEFITDDMPTIEALGYRKRAERYGDIRDTLLDELRLVIKGKDVSAYVTFSSHIKPAAHFARIYGTKNTLNIDYVSRTVTIDQAPRLPSAIGRLLPPFSQAGQYLKAGGKNLFRFAKSDFHFFAGLNYLIKDFYSCITDGGPPPVSHRDILRSARWMEEVMKQMADSEKNS